MDRDGDTLTGDNASLKADREPNVLTSNLLLDGVGEVVVTLNSNGLSWKLLDPIPNDESCCLGTKVASDHETSVTFLDLYAVKFEGRGSIHDSGLANTGGFFSARSFEMYIFKVHAVKRSRSQPSLWIPSVYAFGHKSMLSCQLWVNQINAYINMETDRPKSLLVFVNPRSGKGNGCETWDAVEPIFSLAKVKIKGGDGFFNEVLNGILLSRHKAQYPPTPPDFVHSTSIDDDNNNLAQDSNRTFAELVDSDESPLLFSPTSNNMSPLQSSINEDSQFSLPNERFRFGIIPAGSTDTIAICTTGARDATTSALHIVLGKRVSLDIAQIIRWKTTSTSKCELCVRYAASFAGYGFYGDVISRSEKYRWMGPVRYDYAGTVVFLQHKSYEAEVSYLDVKPEENSERSCCRMNCSVCKRVALSDHHPSESKWMKTKGRFLSVGAAVIACRNDKAPDGLVADAHLADGFLHLILIRDCPRALYLWHLIRLTRKGGSPLNFKFIEHHKTRAFTFSCKEKESVWNVDGELFQADQLSAQVFPGLISLFATGPPL